jgi:hypothetical protein
VIGLDKIPTDTSLFWNLEAINGYDSVAPTRLLTLMRIVSGLSVEGALREQQREGKFGSGSYQTIFEPQPTTISLLDVRPGVRFDLLPRLAVTTIVADPRNPLQPQRVPFPLRQIYAGQDGLVFDIVDSPPRAWVVHQAAAISSDEKALRKFVDPHFDWRGQVIIDGDGPNTRSRVIHQGSGRGTAARRDYLSPNRTAFTVQTAQPGWLVMADMYAPGWHVTVNSRDARLLRADYNLRAVTVPAGRSRVLLTYRPPGYKLGITISAFTMLLLLGLGLASFASAIRRNQRRWNRTGSRQASPGRSRSSGERDDQLVPAPGDR